MIKRTLRCWEIIEYTDVEWFTEEDETGTSFKWRSNDDGTVGQYGWIGPRQEFVIAGSGPISVTYFNG